ncbi:MAG: ParB/RepB/Spo0J family partition protein [Thermoleophilia bacterium]|nr:ParB/RepB/Spo0J family partition protein [Thermoleophilia bacterium]
MGKKTGLGRGLAALLGEQEAITGESLARVTGEEQERGSGVIELPVSAIRRNPRQPRRSIDAQALEELAASIEALGVVQPVIVRQVEGGYELIAGERRWLAAQKAGFTAIPAIVRQASDVESLELALVENIMRQELSPVDEAYALKVLLEDLGVTQESLAARLGRSRSAIANKIRLLDLPAPIQEALAKGELSEGHGRALLGLAEKKVQLEVARQAVEKGWSVRQVEAEVRRLSSRARDKKEAGADGVGQSEIVRSGSSGKDQAESFGAEIDRQLADDLADAIYAVLGVMPRLKIRGDSGVIEVPFRGEAELRDITERLRARIS